MTAALAKPELILPADVDERAEQFEKLKESIEKARLEYTCCQRELATKESLLIELVRTNGGPHATKSKILHGIVWEMVATFSQYTAQDATAVERFRQALVDAGLTRLMKKIFQEDTRYTLKASGDEIVKTGKLTPKLMALLLQCSTTQDKKPSLDVRRKKKTG